MSDDNKIALHDFASLVARRAKVSDVEADTYIHRFAKAVSEELEAGGDVHLYHFGRFHTTHVAEQAGHDPNSGEPLTIPEHTRVHFRPYAALRFAVNAPFRLLHIRELTPDKRSWRTRKGAWISLLLLILILIGIVAWSGMPTRDASVVSPVKAEVVHTEPMPAIDLAAPVHPATMQTSAAMTAFVVSPGDSLWAIAERRFGDPYWWPIIYAQNRPELSRHDPDLIDSGIKLRIPALAGSVNSPDAADLHLRTVAYQIVADDYRQLGNPRAAVYAKVAGRWAEE